MHRDSDLCNEIYASVKEAHDTLIENDPPSDVWLVYTDFDELSRIIGSFIG